MRNAFALACFAIVSTMTFPVFADEVHPTKATRLPRNPIVTPASSETLGDNINGPSLIRVPSWVKHPLGKYYLYFAHHGGKFIRLAYAAELQGPWHIYAPGTLRLEQAPSCYDHIASPDVHVDTGPRELRMYFHCPAGAAGSVDITEQKTFMALSTDGLKFVPETLPLGPAYFRVFKYGGYYYSIVRGGLLLRSRETRGAFERGPTLIKLDEGRILRHAAVDLRGDILRVYYSRIGDRPERILESDVRLTPDWTAWQASEPATVLSPEMTFEGSDQPLEASEPNDAPHRVRQLRDPAVFREGQQMYLVYSIAGESGLAIAHLAQR
ncbi:MAG TPA: hypothetical protein VGO37_12315 [Steroidobacteraceae bacterium]|jgi:hypothetical protein|nr:hypothetical protein [Steroidobacteraceae bacterium]